MTKLIDILPNLVTEIQKDLAAKGRGDLAGQLPDLDMGTWTYDPDATAMYIYLKGQRPLNVVEANIIGTRHGESIKLNVPGMVVIDTDHFNRLTGIEIIGRPDIYETLCQ